MMNFSVTGKKIATPNLTKKAPELNSPFLIQSKPINQKPPTQVKPKVLSIHSSKVQQKQPQAPKVEQKKEVAVKK